MEKVVLEHVLSLMPPATQIRVRETKPKTEKEACDLADNMARARKVTNEAVSHGDKRDAKGDTPKGETRDGSSANKAGGKHKEEKQRRPKSTCWICGKEGHISLHCPSKKNTGARLNEKPEMDSTSATVKAKEQDRIRV